MLLGAKVGFVKSAYTWLIYKGAFLSKIENKKTLQIGQIKGESPLQVPPMIDSFIFV